MLGGPRRTDQRPRHGPVAVDVDHQRLSEPLDLVDRVLARSRWNPSTCCGVESSAGRASTTARAPWGEQRTTVRHKQQRERRGGHMEAAAGVRRHLQLGLAVH